MGIHLEVMQNRRVEYISPVMKVTSGHKYRESNDMFKVSPMVIHLFVVIGVVVGQQIQMVMYQSTMKLPTYRVEHIGAMGQMKIQVHCLSTKRNNHTGVHTVTAIHHHQPHSNNSNSQMNGAVAVARLFPIVAMKAKHYFLLRHHHHHHNHHQW
jgi:hypothetical protein